MALDTFVAGRYSGTHLMPGPSATALDVGITEQGYELSLTPEFEDIGETDAYGQSVIDGVWRGGNCTLSFVSKAFKNGSVFAFWPFGGNTDTPVLGRMFDTGAGTYVPIGTLASDIAGTFLLTATAGTTAANGYVGAPAIATLTASKALLARNTNGRLLFNSKNRDVPITLRLYPFASGNTIRWFTVT